LKKESDECLKRKADLEILADLTKARLDRAEKLTSLLLDEGKRWVETVSELKIAIDNIIGDILLSSACIAYCGPFTGSYRNEMI
jgi:dynein heavy chain